VIAEILDALAQDRGPAANLDIDLSSEKLFEVVENQHRREVIGYLAAHGGCDEEAVQLDDLAMFIAAVSYGFRIGELSHEHKWVAVAALAQTHLPLLDEAGLITFDEEAERIEPSDKIDDVAALLTIIAHSVSEGEQP